MAKYRVLEKSVIGSGIVEAGEIIDYDGESEGAPGANLELITEKSGRAKAKSADDDIGGE